MNRLFNLFDFSRVFFFMLNTLRSQRRFLKKNIKPLLEEIRKDKDAVISDTDVKKIMQYYGYAVPAILGEGFSKLRGEPLTQKERLALTSIGALSGLYDDLFDKLDTPEDHILKLTILPEEKYARNTHELLFIRLYTNALHHCSNPELLKEKSLEVYKAHVVSKKQKDNNLSGEEISAITFLKGGVAFLLYRSTLDEPAEKYEENMIYTLGALMQLENDIFDIYEDHRDNINTLATTSTNIADLRNTYNKMHKELLSLLDQTSFSIKNKLFFIRFINLVLFRGSVCLDCLEKNEKLTNHLFLIKQYTRSQLICDMEKPGNVIKLIQYYINFDLSRFRQ